MPVLPDPGRSRAVLIGASTYLHLADLPAVSDNLSGFRDVLVAPGLGGLPADSCTIVAEPATPVDVYRTLRTHAAAAEDTLLVYFAGHGRTGSRNELFLCLPGTDPEELPYSAWPYDELRRVVANSRATKKVVILDCCFSGRALADQAGDEETILGQVDIEGTYILTATAANTVALAPPGERYTAFTGTLLGLLYEGIPDGPELLTFAQIYPRLQHALTSRQLPRPRQQGSDTITHLALTRNLAYARRGGTTDSNKQPTTITPQLIQQQLLPKSLPDLPGWHVAAFYRPTRTIGGDFYDVIPLPDGRVMFVLGDVTDMGAAAGLVMASTLTLLRDTARRLISSGQVLGHVNDMLCAYIPAHMFVTCLALVLDPASGQVEFANAGHDVPYVRTSGGVQELRARGMPLGLLPGMDYEERSFQFEPGDCALLHSDGLAEAHAPDREMFGFSRVAELVGKGSSAEALIDLCLAELGTFTGPDHEQEDDITLVSLQRSPSAR